VSFSYSGNPANSPIDELRFLLGDTDLDAFILSDEELSWIIAQNGGTASGAYVASLKRIVLMYARLKDESVGEVSIKYSQMYRNYKDMLDREESSTANMDVGSIYAGGIFVDDKIANINNHDIVRPKFTKDLGNNKHIGGSRHG
jgi:hypothetical protein